ncbi:galactosylgalactosylxylosylprotein 3-beta-glucuronosyltransferase I-like [Artemia franciscana]|uniref:galactosylgalactosylxylosylprotein 3-beta-glucuronosyltransferase I-like n=1 Tax=Artemia franciscana TaxID=6661 RepID=UPI0032DA9046
MFSKNKNSHWVNEVFRFRLHRSCNWTVILFYFLFGILLLSIIRFSMSSEDDTKPFQVEDSPHYRQLRAEIARLKQANKKCGVHFHENLNLPTIYAITPTHSRPVQKAELTRLSQTFLLVPNFHWIIVEDADKKTDLVANLLSKSGLTYTHLNAATPKDWKLKLDQPQWKKPRGVIQRNAALEWIRQNAPHDAQGVVYFADDDNVYSLELFEEMRSTKKASVWPVGLAGGLLVERPILNADGKVSEWFTLWRPERPFAIDMAGFCISLQLIRDNPKAEFSWEVPRGYQESHILSAVVTKEELEPKADGCTKVLVWHTRTENPKMTQEEMLKKEGKKPSNYNIEV